MRTASIIATSVLMLLLLYYVSGYVSYINMQEPELAELYFNEPEDIRILFDSVQDVEFSFTISNMKPQQTPYFYVVLREDYIDSALQSRHNLMTGSVVVAPDSEAAVRYAIDSPAKGLKSRIIVSLPAEDLSIHFWMYTINRTEGYYLCGIDLSKVDFTIPWERQDPLVRAALDGCTENVVAR